MPVKLSLLALSLGCGALVACGGDDVEVYDDIRSGTGDEALHSPFVLGARFNLSVNRHNLASVAGWSLESSDPAVLLLTEPVDDTHSLRSTAACLAAGEVVLVVRDDRGDAVRTETVRVAAPTRAEVHPVRGWFPDAPPMPAADESWRLLELATTTLVVEPYEGSERLHGEGFLRASTDGPASLEVGGYAYRIDVDELSVTPSTTGEILVDLAAGEAAPFQTMRIESVGADAIDHIDLLGAEEGDLESEDWVRLMAQAVAEDGSPVFGVGFLWDVVGPESLAADTNSDEDEFTYTFVPDAAASILTARFGDLEASRAVHAGQRPEADDCLPPICI